MKTAVSIPDHVFKKAQRLARQTKRSRSKLFSDALTEYLARHGSDEITDAMNNALAGMTEPPDAVIQGVARSQLIRNEW